MTFLLVCQLTILFFSIYLLGRGYFSSAGLLPADPSPFTKPPHAIDTASSLSRPSRGASGRSHWHEVEGIGESSTDAAPTPKLSRFDRKGRAKAKQAAVRRSQARSQPKTKSITTGYTLETFQPPAPEWVYMTPWMINMRVGTDEGGWRYNSWFKKRGWTSHPGVAGWGGWVRRREWVRLRYIGPQTKPGAREENIDLSQREEVERVPKKLGEVLESNSVRENVQHVLWTMAKLSLDRERLETWQSWLDKAQSKKSTPVWRRLEAITSDEDAVSFKSDPKWSLAYPIRLHAVERSSSSIYISKQLSLIPLITSIARDIYTSHACRQPTATATATAVSDTRQHRSPITARQQAIISFQFYL